MNRLKNILTMSNTSNKIAKTTLSIQKSQIYPCLQPPKKGLTVVFFLRFRCNKVHKPFGVTIGKSCNPSKIALLQIFYNSMQTCAANNNNTGLDWRLEQGRTLVKVGEILEICA